MKKIIYEILAITGAVLGIICLFNEMELYSIPGFICYTICLIKYEEN